MSMLERLEKEFGKVDILVNCAGSSKDKGVLDMNDEELENIGYNKSKNHVDLMVGSKDLCINAITYNGDEILIFKDGSFNI